MISTKQRIVRAALTLFAKRGFHSVSVKEIATVVGIGDSAIYKHFQSKQQIFDTILDIVGEQTQAAYLRIQMPQAVAPQTAYQGISRDALSLLCTALFMFYLEDEVVSLFRRMLTIEQYSNPQAGALYRRIFVEEPLAYQSQLFAGLMRSGVFKPAPPEAMAVHFYAPLFLMLSRYDAPDVDPEAIRIAIDGHVSAFYTAYVREEHDHEN